jgi:uncharacterized membrane protein YebE (DUF533 family)
MNSDEIESIIVKAIIAAGTAWATKHGVTVDGSALQMFAGGVVAAGAGAYGVYRHWGMKKVPQSAVVVPIGETQMVAK